MKRHPEYTYEKDGTIWCVVRWKQGATAGNYTGEKIETYILKEAARRRAYELNGWEESRIYFSHNWNNKLQCNSFTSLRLWNEKKYVEGREFDICLNGMSRGTARLVSVKRLKIEQINEYIARLDTGYPARECREMLRTMYKKSRIDWDTQYLALCLFVYEKTEQKLF